MKLGLPELLIILLVILLIFGAGKLPDVGSAIGKSIRNFKEASKEPDEEKKEPKPGTDSQTAKK